MIEREMYKNLNEALAKTENIGVIGSPSSSTQIKLDILKTAVEKGLIGAFSFFTFQQDGMKHCTLGQITEINLRNPWVEDATIRGLIRQKGRVDPITERQDTHNANMTVGAVFEETELSFNQSLQGNVPPTGTPINLVDDALLNMLLNQYLDEIFYLGRVYGSNPLLPMWFRHFGKEKGGLGEAYHIGVFGKTGSGKSFLSRMVMMGYAKHPKMSIFVLDPQGEFSNSLKDKKSKFYKALNKTGKNIELFDAHNLILTGYVIFKEILKKSKFLEYLTITYPDNQIRASEQIVQALKGKIKGKTNLNSFGNDEAKGKKEIKPWDAYKRESFNVVWNALKDEKVQNIIYPSKETRERLRSMIESGDPDEYYEYWAEFARLFSFQGRSGNNIYIKDLVNKVTESDNNGSIVIINLSKETLPEGLLWDENIQFTVIKELLLKLQERAEQKFKENQFLNTLVILDEAHRFVPREKAESESLDELRSVFIDAIRTTRKYGLGWMFISQTLASLHKEILNQLRIYIFGFGLAWGTELQSLKDIIGGNNEAIKLYQSFRDPQSSIGQKQYPFMGIGPLSPLSFSSTPLFFNALEYESEFFKLNELLDDSND